MKKVFAMLLAIIMTLSMCACGGQKRSEEQRRLEEEARRSSRAAEDAAEAAEIGREIGDLIDQYKSGK